MTTNRRPTPAERAERLQRRTGYLAAVRMSKNPDASPADRQAADQQIDEYFAWVETLPKIGP